MGSTRESGNKMNWLYVYIKHYIRDQDWCDSDLVAKCKSKTMTKTSRLGTQWRREMEADAAGGKGGRKAE